MSDNELGVFVNWTDDGVTFTAPEAYCLRIIEQMNKALLEVGDG